MFHLAEIEKRVSAVSRATNTNGTKKNFEAMTKTRNNSTPLTIKWLWRWETTKKYRQTNTHTEGKVSYSYRRKLCVMLLLRLRHDWIRCTKIQPTLLSSTLCGALPRSVSSPLRGLSIRIRIDVGVCVYGVSVLIVLCHGLFPCYSGQYTITHHARRTCMCVCMWARYLCMSMWMSMI